MEITNDITKGVRDDALAGLDEKTRDLVIKLLARASELAYRRGAQHGAHIATTRPHRLPKSLYDWRYRGKSLDHAPWLDGVYRQSSVNRLFMENHALRRIGLPDPTRGGWNDTLADEEREAEARIAARLPDGTVIP